MSEVEPEAMSLPMKTRVGLWKARLVARRLRAEAIDRLGVTSLSSTVPVLGPIAERLGQGGPAIVTEVPATTFAGEALRWELVDNEGAPGQTLVVTLDRAPANEIGTTMLAELEALAALVRAGAGGARALLFHSAVQRGFCAGADLRELYYGLVAKYDADGRDPRARLAVATEVRGFLDRIHAVFDTFDTAPITVVGALHGVVFGGGFELALTCDVLIADKSTRFAFPELRLGLVPGFGGIPRLRRDLGNAVVRDLLLTGRSVNASRAHAVGLVSQVVPRGKAYDIGMKVAAQAARFDHATTAKGKRFCKPVPRAELEREKDLFVEMLGSPVVEAALRRFVESTDVRPYLP